MKDSEGVSFLQWLLPQLEMRWAGFRKVRRQVYKRIDHRLAELELDDVGAYRQWITDHPEELRLLDDFCRITISRFYRDRSVFDLIRETVLPEVLAAADASGRQEVVCWSAGCASGEEPYSVNIICRKFIATRCPQMSVKILASDSNPHLLERAQRGCYPASSLKDLPHDWVSDCFEREELTFRIKPEHRQGIEWLRQDIRVQMPEGPLDLILCRHLAFTYFAAAMQSRVLAELISLLRPGGYLVTGKQESLPYLPTGLVACGERMGVYRYQRS